MIIGLIVMVVVASIFARLFYVKMKYPYEGRHQLNRVQQVGPTYHPNDSVWSHEPVPNRTVWNARMQGRTKTLTLPLHAFYETIQRQQEEFLLRYMGGWNWQHYHPSQWPKLWQHERRAHGSDLPARDGSNSTTHHVERWLRTA